MLDAPQAAVTETDQPARTPHAAFYALVDRPRRHWLRLHRRWVAEVLTAVTALALALTAFAVAGRL